MIRKTLSTDMEFIISINCTGKKCKYNNFEKLLGNKSSPCSNMFLGERGFGDQVSLVYNTFSNPLRVIQP